MEKWKQVTAVVQNVVPAICPKETTEQYRGRDIVVTEMVHKINEPFSAKVKVLEAGNQVFSHETFHGDRAAADARDYGRKWVDEMLAARAQLAPQPVTIVWLAARPAELEEAKVVMKRCGIVKDWKEVASGPMGRPHYESEGCSLATSAGALVTILTASPTNQGTAAITSLTAAALGLKPSMVVLSGVCAGKRGAAVLGDIIVAKQAFNDTQGGKQTLVYGESAVKTLRALHVAAPPSDFQTQVEHLAGNWHLDTNTPLLQECKPDITAWEQFQRLLRVYYARTESRAGDETETKWLAEHCPIDTAKGFLQHPNRAQLLSYLKETEAPGKESLLQKLYNFGCISLTTDMNDFIPEPSLYAQQLVQVKLNHWYPSPPVNKTNPILCDMYTGEQVRADGTVFEGAQEVSRSADACDTEAWAFYCECNSRAPGMPCLVVKGVSDFADPFKDDQYHKFAKRSSALFLISVIQNWLKTNQ